jgi:hypothetical protein
VAFSFTWLVSFRLHAESLNFFGLHACMLEILTIIIRITIKNFIIITIIFYILFIFNFFIMHLGVGPPRPNNW